MALVEKFGSIQNTHCLVKKIKLEYDPRPQQVEILDFVKDSIQNQDRKFMMIDAPTGVGKSFAAIMIADWYRKEVNESAKIDVITNTKILQDQYTDDFDFISSLKGSNSYWCKKNSMPCGESKMISKVKGKRCQVCPHSIAQSSYINSTLGLTNYHLITAYAMYSPDILADRGTRLLIVDEAHSFEETFCDFIASSFSEFNLSKLGVWESWMEKDLSEISTIRKLSDYVSSVIIPRLLNVITESLELAKETRSRKKKAEFARKADHCDKAMCKYNRFIKDEDNFDKNWVFEKDLDKNGNTRILVEPIWANQYLKKMFWDLYDHVIFMSGTILDPDMMSFLLGLEKDEASYLALPCPFEVEKRPIIYVKFGKMSYYDKAVTFRRAVPIIEKILERNKDNKGIIHSGNYQFNDWIKKAIKDDRLLIHTSSDREETLNKHLRTEDQTVLVSPSMMTGIDLKDDLSRFQIILKVPFPHLGSTKIKKRLETNSDWYNWKTLIEIMQSYGRSVRNDEDWAETYILDACFDQVLGNRIPDYFRKALKIKNLK